VKIVKFVLMKPHEASRLLHLPWFEVLSSSSWSRIFSKYVKSFDVSVTKYASDFNLWNLEVLGRVRTELGNTQCVSVVLVLFMKQLEMKNFLTRGASQEDEGVGCNRCHLLSWKEDRACALWMIFTFLPDDWICHFCDALMMDTD
jgi:hypothetical protein